MMILMHPKMRSLKILLEILTYPDKRLRNKSENVRSFDAKLHDLLDQMYMTMIAKNGVGLAAIQVGVPLRALIINLPDENGDQSIKNLIEVINPEIITKEGSIKFNEGCLSVPEYYDDVERFSDIVVRFKDRFGSDKELEAKEYLAVAFQHEMDHLEGNLFIDRISIMKRKKFEKELKKNRKKKL